MQCRHLLLAMLTLTVLGACTKRDASLTAPAASAPEPTASAAPAAGSAPPAAAAGASSNLSYSPATGEMKDKSWAGQVNEAKAVASAQADAARERVEKAEAAAK